MSDKHSVIHRQANVSLRMEDIHPFWPKYRAKLDIPPQEDRSTLSHWNVWLPAQIEIARGELDKLAEDDDTSNNDLLNLWAI